MKSFTEKLSHHNMKETLLLTGSVILLLLVGCADTQTASNSTTQANSATTAATALTQFGVEAAGTGASIAIVQLAGQNNKHGTAQDILAIDVALLTLLDGTVPTQDQITAVMSSFKSDSSTTDYALISQKIASQFSSQLTAWQKSGATPQQITQYATWFIYGSQLGASIY